MAGVMQDAFPGVGWIPTKGVITITQMKVDFIKPNIGYKILNKGQAYITSLDGKEAIWYCCHVCGETILINNHKITHEIDGTITTDPSLVCPTPGCTGHYWIKHSEIT